MELTTDQKEILNEIPGYVRVEMLERFARFYQDRYAESKDLYEMGIYSGMQLLKVCVVNGWLNDNERFKV